MLDLDQLDLGELCMALEDNSPEHGWWLDPRSGELELWAEFGDPPEEEHPEERGLVLVDPVGSDEAYADLEDFAEAVSDPRARDLLLRAIAGRGAFRRFKDTLLDFQELREVWFAFHDARMERRVIEWLADQGLLERSRAEREALAREDPQLPELTSGFDPMEVATAVAGDLRALYGRRLRRMLLFGSWARGDAHPESDIDLLVVLDRVESPWEELRRMDEILWRHSYRNDAVISAVPAGEDEWGEAARPLLIRAQTEGRAVA